MGPVKKMIPVYLFFSEAHQNELIHLLDQFEDDARTLEIDLRIGNYHEI